MCVKLLSGYLNASPYSQHPTSIYTCGITTGPRMRDGCKSFRYQKKSLIFDT